MEQEEIKSLVRSIVEEVIEASREAEVVVTGDYHKAQHEWIAMKMAEEERKTAFWVAIKSKTLPAAVALVVTSVSASVWHWAVKFFADHWK